MTGRGRVQQIHSLVASGFPGPFFLLLPGTLAVKTSCVIVDVSQDNLQKNSSAFSSSNSALSMSLTRTATTAADSSNLGTVVKSEQEEGAYPVCHLMQELPLKRINAVKTPATLVTSTTTS
ncbi:hypothetical protein ATANTOWER_030908 [Ataeniobius toweri]|uniref:Uncharacterized protein n=1 Tax=Ataeniobius toweri TaxID=208326 RepID=A0ABU7CL56_9TELE|nr:hypothetical protein [Ataeniobius toweri]